MNRSRGTSTSLAVLQSILRFDPSQGRPMLMSDAVKLAVLAVIFGCGAALLSYRFYAAYRRWSFGEFSGKAHLPGILGTALMLLRYSFRILSGMDAPCRGRTWRGRSLLFVCVRLSDVDRGRAVRTGFRCARDLSGTHEILGLATPTAPQPSRRDRHRAVSGPPVIRTCCRWRLLVAYQRAAGLCGACNASNAAE